jgi:hypothetical protein
MSPRKRSRRTESSGDHLLYITAGPGSALRTDAELDLAGCIFDGNRAYYGSALYAGAGQRISSCTFTGNENWYSGQALLDTTGLLMDHTIIAFNQSLSVLCNLGSASLSCCDIFGNESYGGYEEDWVGCIAGQLGIDGNVHVDPEFCDPAHGDWHLRSTSPCAPENNPSCGLIGAWPVGCGPVATVATSWGELKAVFRATR